MELLIAAALPIDLHKTTAGQLVYCFCCVYSLLSVTIFNCYITEIQNQTDSRTLRHIPWRPFFLLTPAFLSSTVLPSLYFISSASLTPHLLLQYLSILSHSSPTTQTLSSPLTHLTFFLSHPPPLPPPSSFSSSYTFSCRPSQAMLTLLSGWLIARWIVVNSLANDWREWARRREEQSGARLESNRLMYGCRLLSVAEVNSITHTQPPPVPTSTTSDIQLLYGYQKRLRCSTHAGVHVTQLRFLHMCSPHD